MPVTGVRTLFSAAFAAFLFATMAAADTEPPQIPAGFQGFEACALIISRDRHRERRVEFRSELCGTPLPPCSTFKIPNALIGLQTGVVSGPADRREWDEVQRRVAAWNRNHTLASAIHYSVVWYFQELARDVGPERMARWLAALNYGNRDISGGIDTFWLGSTLKIDPRSQLELIKRLTHGALPFKPEYQRQVKDMLKLDSKLPGQLHGKTGTCPGDAAGEPDTGWFVGWVRWHKSTERNPVTTWFVLALRGDDASGLRARRLTQQLLFEHQP